MERRPPPPAFWGSHLFRRMANEALVMDPFPETGDEDDAPPLISIDTLLPDDLLEKILACLPIASIFRASSVCRRWHDIVKSRRFLWNSTHTLPQKPWYFMFTSGDIAAGGHAYDPALRKWYAGVDLPCIESSGWTVSSSGGLVCFMDNDSRRSRVYVCNPITKRWRGLEEPPDVENAACYTSLALAVDRKSRRYRVTVAKSFQLPDDFARWEFSVHVYDSEAGSWAASAREVLEGWRGGEESVICNGVLYCLIYSTGVFRHGLIMHDLSSTGPSSSSSSRSSSLLENSIPAPCPLTCGRLMNLGGKLVMVGGIGKQDRADIIKGIGVWELENRSWREVARMPQRFFQGFGEFDDVFASSGADDLIYIQSYGAPALLVFDVKVKQWRWSQKCPVTKRFPLQLFSGFCFEPRLEISP